MSQKRLIKVRTFPGATIQDMKFFIVKSQITLSYTLELVTPPPPSPPPDPHSSSYEMFHEIQSLRNFILKYFPSVRITISTLVLGVDKANANDINKAFTELVKESNLDYISHENIKESHINEYGLHINRTGSSILAKNLISGIRNF